MHRFKTMYGHSFKIFKLRNLIDNVNFFMIL